jgi:hypothetical protein
MTENFSPEDVAMLGLEQPNNIPEATDKIYVEPETVAVVLRVISNRDDLMKLESERPSAANVTKGVHLAFRPSSKDIMVLTNKLPGLEIVQTPKSYRSSISSAMQIYLENIQIALIEGDVWGHRKDINEWADVKILKSKYDAAVSKFAKQ